MMYKLDTILPFGKYKGKTVEQVLEIDPTYIRWCLENIEAFEMSNWGREFALSSAEIVDIEEYEEDSFMRSLFEDD